MQVITQKRQSMIPQLEAAHIGAMVRLCRAFDNPESRDVLDRIDRVKVELSERMATCGGKALMKTRNGMYHSFAIRLNARLLALNPDELIPTYLHELAHIVTNLMYEKQCGHGHLWKNTMQILGISDERCHQMDVSAFARPKKRFSYVCIKCSKEYKITIAKHKKAQHYMAQGASRYICRCAGRLEHRP